MLECLVLAAALSAVPGTPENPAPGEPPTVWLTWADDDLSPREFFGGTNHRRTFQGTAGVVADPAVVVFDYSTLDDSRVGRRIDEVTLTAGLLGRWRDGIWAAHGAVGGGGRLRGNFGGNIVQRNGHDLFNDEYSDSAYVGANDVALAYGYGRGALGEGRPVMLEVVLPVAATSDGQLQADAEGRVVGRYAALQAWVGGRLQRRRGDTGSAPGDYTAAFEDGEFLTAGAAIGWLSAHVLYRPDLDEDNLLGAIGLSFRM
jgi:hypothetical protein